MKLPKWFKNMLVLLLSGSAYMYIITKLSSFEGWDTFYINYQKLSTLIGIQLILLFLNLWAESKKWQHLISNIYPTSIYKSAKMVFAGFTSGIITPFRSGEPIGRIRFVPKKYYKPCIIANYFGGIMQTAIIVSLGSLALFLYPFELNIHYNQSYWLIATILLCIIMTVILLINSKIANIKTRLRNIAANTKITWKTIYKAHLYSLLRYIIYSIQLCIALYVLNKNLTVFYIIQTIPIYYFFITILPSYFLADLGIRGSVALFLFSKSTTNEPAILASVFLIWFICQAIPAMFGGILLLNKRKSYT